MTAHMTVPSTKSIPSLAAQSLRRNLVNAALEMTEFHTLLDQAAQEIRDHAKPQVSEATIEGVFERVLYAHLRDIGLQFHPNKEVTLGLRRHTAHGRMDSRLDALVIEFKRPALLRTQLQIERACEQLKTYLLALNELSHVPCVGLLTNGILSLEVRASDGNITHTSAPEHLTGAVLLRITRHIIALAHTALTPENLIQDFCGSNTDGILFQTAHVLFSILSDPFPKTQMLNAEWRALFQLAHDDKSQQKRIKDRQEALGRVFSVHITDAATEYRALFAIHTAYAILLKFIAYRTISDIYLGRIGQDYCSLSRAADIPLRTFCVQLEEGEVFRQLGIINLLEGDFFSWYCDPNQWTPGLAEAIRTVLTTLARYEEAGHIFEANEAPDLFRDLYQKTVPQVVRSSFGEFYTPFWLAEQVLESAKPEGQWRAIDPCCGSGTFIVAAISRLKKECQEKALTPKQQYCGQKLSSHLRDGAIVTQLLVIGAGFFQAMPLG